jgi:hypothetical protein
MRYLSRFSELLTCVGNDNIELASLVQDDLSNLSRIFHRIEDNCTRFNRSPCLSARSFSLSPAFKDSIFLTPANMTALGLCSSRSCTKARPTPRFAPVTDSIRFTFSYIAPDARAVLIIETHSDTKWSRCST